MFDHIRKQKQYEKAFADLFESAFADNKKLRKKLIDTADLLVRNQYDELLEAAEALMPYAKETDALCAVLIFRALANTNLGKSEEAIADYREVLRLDSKKSRVWSNLSSLLIGKGEAFEAISCCETALQYHNQSHVAYNNLASAYFQLNDYHHAIEYAKKALAIRPDLYQASNTLCLSYAALNDSENSRANFLYSVKYGVDPHALQDKLLRKLEKISLEERKFHPSMIGALSEFQRKTLKPCVRMCLPAPEGKSHVGGAPIGEAPLDSNGKPMRLLCAVYCSELKKLPDFPTSGVLLFYIADDEMYGASFESPNEQKNFRVIYLEEEPTFDASAEMSESDTFPVFGCHTVLFDPFSMPMTSVDYRFADEMDACLAEAGLSPLDHTSDRIADTIYEKFHREGHRLGGYPHFTQTDVRDDDEAYRNYDTLLLQIDSQDDPNGNPIIQIGDCGVLNFFIPHEKLKAKDFSDILYTWDCY